MHLDPFVTDGDRDTEQGGVKTHHADPDLLRPGQARSLKAAHVPVQLLENYLEEFQNANPQALAQRG